MTSVWKRLQRVNKRAAKFQYTASYHRVDLETTPKWKPNKLSVVWTRRSRRVITDPLEWEPSLKDPLKGSVIYTVPENQTVAVTLFKDSRTNELEDKDWTFVLEDVSPSGKRRRLGACSVNLRLHASLEPSQRPLALRLEPATRKVRAASLHLTLHCVLLREGHATDEDMQSLASLLSVNNNSDIAVLEDLDEDDYTLSDNSTRQMLDFRQQMEEMTQSLTNSDIAATPNSVQSLNFDNSQTPTAPITPELRTPTTPAPDDTTPTEEPKIEKSRPEILSHLTKMAMKMEQPKFSSTPKPPPVVEPKVDNLKGMVLKPKTIAKRNLKPLEFKTNLNYNNLDKNDNEKDEDSDKTPTADVEKLSPGAFDKDKTPVQDLLEWCQSVTREYASCRVTNLTTSFRNGLAFCAIIHRFRPDLIDFSGLQPEQGSRNVRAALAAGAALGVPRALAAADVCRPAPDRLAIMTYLFQLRAHFTGSELQVEQLGKDSTECSYLVGRHDTDGELPAELFSREVSARRSRTCLERPAQPQTQPLPLDSPGSPLQRLSPEKPSSPTAKDVRDMFLHQSKSILGKMLSPARADKPSAKWFSDPLKANEPVQVLEVEPAPAWPEQLMTRRDLLDPFGSVGEDEEPAPMPTPTVTPDPTETPEPTPLANGIGDNVASNHTQPQSDLVTSPDGTEQSDNRLQKTSPPELPKPTPQLLTRHDELKERARALLEATKREAREKDRMRREKKEREEATRNELVNGMKNGDLSPKKAMTEEERQAMLRERARKLIADARAGIVSPPAGSPARPHVEIISEHSVMQEIQAAGGVEKLDALLARADSLPASRSSPSPDRSEGRSSASSRSGRGGSPGTGEYRRSPLQSFAALVDRLTPDKTCECESECACVCEGEGEGECEGEGGSYIASELAALEREQAAVDETAAALEKQLRFVMDQNVDTHEEDKLMSQWFNLVNKKNALLRRQMQLNILEREQDLSRRCELLARELRLSLAVDEWRKTASQRRRERLLLQELLSAVNERDRLVQEMDEQEKAIANDDEIERNLSQVEIQRKNNCILQ